MDDKKEKIKIGWREWVSLPDLEIPAIKAKIDTGAKTSAIHTFFVETFKDNGKKYIKFKIHPLQKNTEIEIECNAPLYDRRIVKDSGGHVEERFVIITPVKVGELVIESEITLTNREDMQFRMLLGRSTLNKANVEILPNESYLLGRKKRKIYKLSK